MRLPFPERVPLFPTLVFCMVLCSVQILQGTTPVFSVCTAAIIILAVVAFNTTGGMTRPSGAWVLGYSLFGVIFGVIYKAFVGEPGQTNLLQPDRTMELYAASMAALVAACYLGRRFRSKRNYLPKFASLAAMYRACVGCLLVGSGLVFLIIVKPSLGEAGTVFSGFAKLTGSFVPLSILFGVMYEIHHSKGKRSVNGPVLFGILLTAFFGVINYSKEGMLAPFISWIVPVAALRYRVNLLQVASIVVALAFTVYYLVPYSQYGRNFKDPTASFSENLKTNLVLLSNLGLVRKVYLQSSAAEFAEDSLFHYYNTPQGFADRIQMITPDDAIIDATEHGAVFGLFPTIFSFENIVPHLLWPSKPIISWGNTYAHELGILGDEEDETTGISFSPTGDAYHQAKWAGVLVVFPLLAFMLFVVMDSICGDTRLSPFALGAGMSYLHVAAEGGITQFAPAAIGGALGTMFVAFAGAYVMPLLADLLLGPPKDAQSKTTFLPGFRRIVPSESAEVLAE